MKRLKKYQIDGEFSNMKELKGVTTPFRDSHWFDKTKTPNYINEYDNYLPKFDRIIEQDYRMPIYYNNYDYRNVPVDFSNPNFLNQVIDLTNKAYSPELFNMGLKFINNKNYGNKIEFNETLNNDDNIIHNIFQNHKYNAQYKNVNGQTDWERENCYIDSNGYKICGFNPFQLGHKHTDFETINKYKTDAARRTYQIATRDFTPYDFEGMLNQPKSYRMADESKNTPIAYGPDNETRVEYFQRQMDDFKKSPEEYEKKVTEEYYKSPEYAKLKADSDKEYEERNKKAKLESEQRIKEALESLNRNENLETLNRKEINQLPSQNIAVPDINRNIQSLPGSKPVRETRTMKLTPQEEAEFFKKNNIQPVPKNKTRKLTPAEEIEFKKKYNIK